MARLTILAFFIANTLLSTFAQDIHLSQFYLSPLTVNPAVTGSFYGDYRLMSNYKNQWKSITNAYNTVVGSFDMKIFSPEKNKSNYLAAGISFLSDKAGKSAMGLTQVNLDVAYNIQISKRSGFAAGIETSYAQKSIRLSDLKWDNQFDGNYYDPGRSSNQNIVDDSFGYLDLGTGIEFKHYNLKKKIRVNVGASAYHINQPKISFLGNQNEKLSLKYIGYANAHIRIMKLPYYIVPQLMYVAQGPYKEIVVGGYFKYVFGQDMSEDGVILNTYTLLSSFVQCGALYRAGDALVIITSVELKKSLSLGLSYDLNISKLRVASSSRGGIEISLAYRGSFKVFNPGSIFN